MSACRYINTNTSLEEKREFQKLIPQINIQNNVSNSTLFPADQSVFEKSNYLVRKGEGKTIFKKYEEKKQKLNDILL